VFASDDLPLVTVLVADVLHIFAACFLLVFMSCVWMNNLCVMKDDDTSDHLTDGNTDTYWETDGGVGTHWIKLTMKPGTIIRYMIIYAESL